MNLCIFYSSINYTYLALIPKNANAYSVGDYRPISLYNALYKIIAKVLANHLKQVLPMVISQQQSAFLLGPLITDNILVAYKAFHTMETRAKREEWVHGPKARYEQSLQ
jgi:hypothetical protein